MRSATIVQGVAQALEAYHRADKHRRQIEREQSIGNGLAARQRALRSLLVDMDPLSQVAFAND
jgi:hypothetical protein